MKKLFAKFRLSNALDNHSGGKVPDPLRRKIDASPDLRDFAHRAAAVDRALRRPPPVADCDSTLHHSIMRAVRATAAEPAPKRVSVRLEVAMAVASLALAAVGVWLAARPPASNVPMASSRARTLAAAQIVLDMGGQISRSVPDSVVAPLSHELASMDLDIQDTTKFVMGVLP